jgi:hypothetical protein
MWNEKGVKILVGVGFATDLFPRIICMIHCQKIDTLTDCRNSSALKGQKLNWDMIVAYFLASAQSYFAGIFQVYGGQRFSQQLHAIAQLDVAITISGVIPHFSSLPTNPQILEPGSTVAITEAP